MTKSYWQTMGCRTDRDKEAIKSWFEPWCDGLTPESAEVLCDKATDREKKLRAVMVDESGDRFRLTRTTGRTFSIKRERLPELDSGATRTSSGVAASTPTPIHDKLDAKVTT